MQEETSKDFIGSQFSDDRMSDSDALMWSIEKDPALRSTITTVMLFDDEPSPESLRVVFDRASRSFPRLRQRVRGNPLSMAPPRWEIDPNFDLRYHFRTARVIGSGSMQDLLEMTAPIAMQGFDRARPLWEATLVEGLSNQRSALIMKFHHSITDGVGGVELMMELLDLEADAPERALAPEPPVHVLNQAQRFMDAFVHESRRGAEALGSLAANGLETLQSFRHDPVGSLNSATELFHSISRVLAPESHPMSALASERSLSSKLDVLTMPLDVAKAAGKKLDGSLNDVFIAGLVLGLDRYHGEHGVNQQRLRMGMPINVRGAASMASGGNEWVPARFEIDLRHSSLKDLVGHVHKRALEARDEPANSLVAPLSNMLNRLPTTVITQVFGMMMKGLDFQASNVPGSPLPLYMAGSRVASIFPFGPLAGAGMNVTLFSYNNDVNIGINLDPAAVPDSETFFEALREAYDEILAEA